MPKVRTTINPTVELDVSEREALGLKADGLLLETKATTLKGLTDAGERQSLLRESPVGINVNVPDTDDVDTQRETVEDNDENNSNLLDVNAPGNDETQGA